jgi:hypothetical protein
VAFITADRVLDSSTSTGTGAFVVSGTPAAGYRTFSAVMSVGDTCYYSIQGQTTSEWEVGLGTYSSANTLTRTTIYSSSNAGSAVTFSAGTKNVFITIVASKAPQLDPSGNVTALGTPASATLTNATGLSLTTGVTGVLPSVNGGSLAWQSVQTGNFTAVAGNAYPVNTTSGAVTVTLPASPTAGQIIQVTDYAGTWQTNNVTVSPNGNKINGSTSNYLAFLRRESLAFVYIDSTQGWVVYSGVNTTNAYVASYLIVAGGGGGGYGGGGGGAGGLLSGTSTLVSGTTYAITVGAGGAGGTSNGGAAPSGSISVFSTFTATGGGGGGNEGGSGASGGSGGGGGRAVTSLTGGSGTSGQGNSGGNNSTTAPYPSGGGGGASAVGAAGSGTASGAGGAGTASSITGSSVTYAGGGGGGGNSATNTGGAGGSGGGGAGGSSGAGTAGTANTGGGGGGSSNTLANIGGAGGSGVVILSVPTANYTGVTAGSPTITTSGSNTIIKFTASGSYTA